MKPKSFMLFVVALGCGLVAMLGIKQAMSGNEQGEEEMIPVLRAKTSIKANVPLTADLVEFQPMAASQVPFGAVTREEDYQDRALKSGVVQNDIIMLAKLGEKGEFDASTEIPEGMRLVSVPVTLTTSHSGQIRPGDRVDVYVTYSAEEGGSGRNLKTKLVLDYIEVFAIDNVRNSERAANDDVLAKNVSLLVTPKQASILIMGESKGDLQLALRSKDDDNLADVDPIDEREFDQIGTEESAREKEEEKNKLTEAELAEAKAKELDAQKLIEELRAQNARLQAKMQTMQDTPVAVPVAQPELWKIQVYAGQTKDEYEFEIDSKVPQPTQGEQSPKTEEETQEKTSALPTSGNPENPMQVLLNRLFVGS